jgi:hypothetical protein
VHEQWSLEEKAYFNMENVPENNMLEKTRSAGAA